MRNTQLQCQLIQSILNDEWDPNETIQHYDQYISILYNQTIYGKTTLNEYELDIVVEPLEELISQADFLIGVNKPQHALAICTTILSRVEEIDLNTLSETQAGDLIVDVSETLTHLIQTNNPKQHPALTNQFKTFLNQIPTDNMYLDEFEKLLKLFE
ncbi:MAG: hypothetical protein WC341_13180 [Bacteroidales bacterium]|jgi:hypothetical protein